MRISESALPQCTCMCLKLWIGCDLHCSFFFKHYWQQQYCGHVSEDCIGQWYMRRCKQAQVAPADLPVDRPAGSTACNCPSNNSTYQRSSGISGYRQPYNAACLFLML